MAITEIVPAPAGYTGTVPNRATAASNEAYATDVYNYLLYFDDTFVTDLDSLTASLDTYASQANNTETNINNKEATVVAKEALVSPHYTAIDAVAANEANINAVATDIIPNLAEILQADTNAQTASAAAVIAIGAVNYKGEWVSGYATTGYSLGMSVSYTDGFNYTSKIDNNLVEPTTKTNTTEWNWIEAIDPSTVYTKTETDTLLGGKQATLVSGTNIKTVGGVEILGAGDLSVTSRIGYVTGTTSVTISGLSFTNGDVLNFSISGTSSSGNYPTMSFGGATSYTSRVASFAATTFNTYQSASTTDMYVSYTGTQFQISGTIHIANGQIRVIYHGEAIEFYPQIGIGKATCTTMTSVTVTYATGTFLALTLSKGA